MIAAEQSYSEPPTKANLKAWWNQFTFVQRTKKEVDEFHKVPDTEDHPVFGKPLKESLRYANVQISTASSNGELYVWGYIPVVVAKCGLYLKENATEVEGTFRVNGSNKRMRELQAQFESPPRYGKSLDWRQESYTTHDVASVFRRYLTQMPEPVIPYDMYHLFRDALSKNPNNPDVVIASYKSFIRRLPRANQYLLLYVLDLLSVFARKSDKNLMTATNLAVIFRPGLISHPDHEMLPPEHALSQRVLEFLIAQQDWFMFDISPPPQPGSIVQHTGGRLVKSPNSRPIPVSPPQLNTPPQTLPQIQQTPHAQPQSQSLSPPQLHPHQQPSNSLPIARSGGPSRIVWDTDDGKLATNSDDDYEFSEVGGSWSFVPRGVPGAQQGSGSLSEKERLDQIKMMRRKTTLDFGDPSARPVYGVLAEGDMSPDVTGKHEVGSVVRSRTLPTSRRRGGEGQKETLKERDKERDKVRVLKKKRSSMDKSPLQASTGANAGGGATPPTTWTQPSTSIQNQEWTSRADG